MLGAAFNDNAPNLVPGFTRDYHPAFPVGFCSRDSAFEYQQQPLMSRSYVPQLVFVDRQGVIRAQYSGDDPLFQDPAKNLREVIERLLNDKSATSPHRRRAGKGGEAQSGKH